MMKKWHKDKWKGKAETVRTDTASALQTVFDNLNQGQQKKLLKAAEVKALFDRYGVAAGGEG